MNNFFIIILDGVGVGELPDADIYGDLGSNTLSNIAKVVKGLNLPNLTQMGLGNIVSINGIPPVQSSEASFGKMTEVSKGKDSTSGHWEIAGLKITKDFSYFPNGFPEELINKFLHLTGCKGVLGNKPASGTEIIKELGEEHQKTGFPIVYTSGDSVFQIACHEETIPLNRLYEICEITRHKVLTAPLHVGRVIARPFLGAPGTYKRTTNRKDFSLDPPSETILDLLQKNNIPTVAIGKINDLFNYKGISIQEKTKSNKEGCLKLLEYSVKSNNSFIFANLVDFDVYYGHRNDPFGFANALNEFDEFLPEFLNKLHETDLLIITADHGNDPTSVSTDHSREYVPLLFYQKGRVGKNLGTRSTFADVAKTVAEFFKVRNSLEGKSFLYE
ncbi:MAG: phosphopentomutase [Ignavibacteriaceae bacterium]|nr:phosphopentomutase [Ignavibacteriaceae bacterium]